MTVHLSKTEYVISHKIGTSILKSGSAFICLPLILPFGLIFTG